MNFTNFTHSSPQVVFDEPGLGKVDTSIDPRPRHKLELRALIATTDALKKERESMGKTKAEKKIRIGFTEKIAELEAAHRTRVAAELEAYLNNLKGEELEAEKASAISKLNFKKSWYVTRNKHTMGKRR